MAFGKDKGGKKLTQIRILFFGVAAFLRGAHQIASNFLICKCASPFRPLKGKPKPIQVPPTDAWLLSNRQFGIPPFAVV
jgi:hypothetical protein